MTYLEMQNKAKNLWNERYITPFMEVGGVTAVIETGKGNVYCGVNIDADCGMGFCAERNAASTMLTNGESKIVKLLCYKDGELVLPCCACREFLMQLHIDNKDMKIITNAEKEEFVTLKDLVPNWWGNSKYEKGIVKRKWD